MKKFFKKIGGGIRKAFGKVGKFMGELGWAGQLAMMFVPIPGIGSIMQMAGNVAAQALSKIPGGQKIVDGANFMLDKARDFKDATKQKFPNISETIGDWYDTTVNYVNDKLGFAVDTQEQQHQAFVDVGAKEGGEATSKSVDDVQSKTEDIRNVDLGRTERDIARDEGEKGTGTTSLLVEAGQIPEVPKSKSGRGSEISVDTVIEEGTPTTDTEVLETSVEEKPDSLLGSNVKDELLDLAWSYVQGPPEEMGRARRPFVATRSGQNKPANVGPGIVPDAYSQYVSDYPVVPNVQGMYPSNTFQQTFESLRPLQ
jgi:hypothetical protein